MHPPCMIATFYLFIYFQESFDSFSQYYKILRLYGTSIQIISQMPNGSYERLLYTWVCSDLYFKCFAFHFMKP